MHIHFDTSERPYTELTSHFAYRVFGFSGDAAVAFAGPCRVKNEDLVDWADRRAGDYIAATRMLHFIIEHFGVALREAVWRQRLLVSLTADALAAIKPEVTFNRDGDDIFVGDGKLTVSIATVSPVSALIHLGINIDGSGAPVRTADLDGLGIEPAGLARILLERYAAEVASVDEAVCKVRGLC
jgi:hypothetical protein